MTVRPTTSDVAGILDTIGLHSVLAVCAHPDDESFGLGAVLVALADAGVSTAALSFTRGEASTLNLASGDLAVVRAAEFAAAAEELAISASLMLDYADGGLADTAIDILSDDVVRYATARDADSLLVFDLGGVTGHPDHQRATEAALLAAGQIDLPVLAWTIPESVADTLNTEFGTAFVGRARGDADLVFGADRGAQRRAIALHASQATDNPVLWRRLELSGDTERLRWLRR